MIFETTTQLNTSIEDAFAFHCDIKNLPKFSPADTHVEVLNDVDEFKKGTVIELKAQKGLKTMHWVIEVSEFNPPYSFTDTALKSPFKKWVHTHSFHEKNGVTYLTDTIEVHPPLGWFGKLFESYIQKELQKMFSYRHKAYKELLT